MASALLTRETQERLRMVPRDKWLSIVDCVSGEVFYSCRYKLNTDLNVLTFIDAWQHAVDLLSLTVMDTVPWWKDWKEE